MEGGGGSGDRVVEKQFFSALPEECISYVLSLTSPRDACRFSVISPEFRSAAESDAVWMRFLPSDYSQIISRSVSPVIFSSKKQLYFTLCDSPILLDGGTKSFGLEKSSGKKCYMLGARELNIAWGDTEHYWNWISMPDSPSQPKSRFSEVAYLQNVCWLDINGKMETGILSPCTAYAAYLVYTVWGNFHGLENPPVKVSIRFAGEEGSEMDDDAKNVYLKSPTISRRWGWGLGAPRQTDGQLPCNRGDGWLEIEIGEFFSGLENSMVEMRVYETRLLNWKKGLIVQGIELRPKESRI